MAKAFSLQSFASGIAIGIIAAVVWVMGVPKGYFGEPVPIPIVEAGDTTELPDSGAVAVLSQPAGSSVRVESLTVPPPGVWVAIREVVGKELRNVLGAVRIGGPKTDFSVPLLRDTLPGRTYAIELYRDDGSGSFNPNMSAYVDFDTGKRVVEYFATTP